MPSVADARLAPLLEVRGVRQAALFSASGELLGAVGGLPDAGVAQAGRAVAASLQSMLGGELQDLLIELGGLPVLLTPSGGNTLLLVFDEVGNVGRVRFAVKKLLPELR